MLYEYYEKNEITMRKLEQVWAGCPKLGHTTLRTRICILVVVAISWKFQFTSQATRQIRVLSLNRGFQKLLFLIIGPDDPFPLQCP